MRCSCSGEKSRGAWQLGHEEDAERLDEAAREADRSRSAELRIAIRAYLERTDHNELEEEQG